MIIKEMPENERPREKLISRGKESLTNSELLALLIGTGTIEKTALRLADEILALDDRGVSFLRDCTPEELTKIEGVGSAKASRLLAAVELGKRISTAEQRRGSKIKQASDVADMYIEKMRYYSKEHLEVILLNTQGEIIGSENISVGDLNSSIANPREAFKTAVKRSAWGTIFVHNHPAGDPAASKADIDTTRRLCEAGKLLGIEVLDHIIIGDGTFTSMKRDGYF